MVPADIQQPAHGGQPARQTRFPRAPDAAFQPGAPMLQPLLPLPPPPRMPGQALCSGHWLKRKERHCGGRHGPAPTAARPHAPNAAQPISRADAARYMYMYVWGGVYADLDMEALKPMDDLLAGKDAALGYMGPPDGFKHNIPNAWMASRPGHPFWLLMLKRIQQADMRQDAESITGAPPAPAPEPKPNPIPNPNPPHSFLTAAPAHPPQALRRRAQPGPQPGSAQRRRPTSAGAAAPTL
jgi:hypothetical protein